MQNLHRLCNNCESFCIHCVTQFSISDTTLTFPLSHPGLFGKQDQFIWSLCSFWDWELLWVESASESVFTQNHLVTERAGCVPALLQAKVKKQHTDINSTLHF